MTCYFPTTTMVIDDDILFLNAIQSEVRDCITYTSPSKAIEALKSSNPFTRIHSNIVKNPTQSDDINTEESYFAYHVNLHKLHEEIYSKQRFDDISLIIVDYHMPDINGIELCKKLTAHPSKKILLTGGLNNEKAVIDAFNNGVIHKFISKAEPHFKEKLNKVIKSLKTAFFKDLTSALLPSVSTTNIILNNPAYIKLIHQLQNQLNTTEYYLFDTNGSSIFLDNTGTPSWLIIKHESDLDNYLDILMSENTDNITINMLKKREVIPFFFSEKDYQQPPSVWNDYLYSASPFPEINKYYYTLIKGNIRNHLKNIVSYNSSKQMNSII